jgi:leucyl aminopeptidase (aminopeptidase T)
MNGTLVIDGYLWPPHTVGPLQESITIEVAAGSIQAIGGASADSAALINWLRGQSPRVEHFCIGYNPGAALGGSLMEAERAFGHLNVGVGRYPRHADGVMKMPRVTLDGEVLMERGTFTHPSLVELARALGH